MQFWASGVWRYHIFAILSLPNAGYKRNQIAVKTQMFTIPQRESSWNACVLTSTVV